MSQYSALIIQATHCAPEDAAIIENIMRTEIFHSTLDWQSLDALQNAAIEAKRIYITHKLEYDAARNLALQLFNESKGQHSA